MTPERLPLEETPRHRAELRGSHPPTLAAESIIAFALAQAPDGEAASRLLAAYLRRGRPLAAFLTLTGVDAFAAGLQTDFEAAYLATFRSRAELVADTVETFGWRRDLERLIGTHIELVRFVTFDEDAVVDFVADHYDLVETTDGLFVFEAWQRPDRK